jgi:mannose-6-phosphate isomerase-like protein (cupin superfamily)
MVPESPLESTEHGLVPTGKGWFVLNAREAPWWERDRRGFYCEFEGFEEHEPDFSQLGVNLQVLGPGEPMSMYHWEADQEDFLVLAGEALLIVEGGERPLRQFDFVHCPPGTKRSMSSSVPETGPASYSQSAPETARPAQTGAATPWTRPRCATARAWSGRRPTGTRRTRDSPMANERGTARAGCRSK